MTRGAPGGRPLAYTPDEAAELLRVSPSLIRSLVCTGALPRVAGLGRAVRIPSRALYEFVGDLVLNLPAAIEIEPAESTDATKPVARRRTLAPHPRRLIRTGDWGAIPNLTVGSRDATLPIHTRRFRPSGFSLGGKAG
jgi:excisionase family DNA binding protein